MSIESAESRARAGIAVESFARENEGHCDRLDICTADYCRLCSGPCFVNEEYVESVLQDCSGVVWQLCLRMVIVLLMFCFFLYIQALFILSSENANYIANRQPLVDRLQQATASIADRLTISYANSIIGALFFCYSIRIFALRPPVYALQMFIRYGLIMGVLYLVRGMFIGVTVMPSPKEGCLSTAAHKTHLDAIGFIFKSYMGMEVTCTDLIISGHTMFVTVVGMLFIHNCYNITLNLASVVFILAVYFILIVSRNHYTVDVLFGVVFAIVSYTNYCLLLDRCAKMCRSKWKTANMPTNIKFLSEFAFDISLPNGGLHTTKNAACAMCTHSHRQQPECRDSFSPGIKNECIAMDVTFSVAASNANATGKCLEAAMSPRLNAVSEEADVIIEMSDESSSLNESQGQCKTCPECRNVIYQAESQLASFNSNVVPERQARENCYKEMHQHYCIDAMARFIGFFEAIDHRIKTATALLHVIAHEKCLEVKLDLLLWQRVHWMDSLMGASEYRTNKSALYFGHPMLYTRVWRNAYGALLAWYGKSGAHANPTTVSLQNITL